MWRIVSEFITRKVEFLNVELDEIWKEFDITNYIFSEE